MGQQGTKKKRTVLPGVAGLTSALLVVWLGVKVLPGATPSDSRLAGDFQKHRSLFIELKAMITTNNPSRNPQASTTVWSMQDYKRYLELRRQAGVNRAYVESGEYHFQVFGPETAGPAKTRIAVVWREEAPDSVIESIDQFQKSSAHQAHAYRSLGEGWYLWISK